MQQSTFNARTANIARARIVHNKKKDTFTVVVAFNITEVNEDGKYKFPPQKKCDYVSGEFIRETFMQDLARIIDHAEQALCTKKIEFV